MSGKRRARALIAALAGLTLAGTARSGPPFLTDDPEPTDTGHWEIYAPAAAIAGKGRAFEGTAGAEINYGAAPDVQVTLGLPMAFAHDRNGWTRGRGDLEASVKYRVFHDEAAGVSIALFPGLTLPTASRGLGNRRVTALLPVWAQRDSGPWSIFGGGGFAINPGAGNRNYWTGGIAATRTLSQRLLVGVEVDRQGADAIDGRASTSLGLGAIRQLGGPLRLLFSGGPTFTDGDASPGFHGFAALGVNF